nr:hypothetical protein [Micromonospora olivasterospora]
MVTGRTGRRGERRAGAGDPRRTQKLQAEYADAPVSLALYMGAQFARAAEDLTWAPAGTLHRRFLGWLR